MSKNLKYLRSVPHERHTQNDSVKLSTKLKSSFKSEQVSSKEV